MAAIDLGQLSIAPLSVSPSDVMSSFILSMIQHGLRLPWFLFPRNLACIAFGRICSTSLFLHDQSESLNDFVF